VHGRRLRGRQRKLLVQFKYNYCCKHVAWLLGLITCGRTL